MLEMNIGRKAGRILRPLRGSINVPLLRIIVGSLGIALPFVLMIWGFFLKGWSLEGSISDYYHMRTHDAFVGILFVIGWVLFAYRGYERNIDGVAGSLACLFALGVALFPNTADSWTRFVHYPCAACLFLLFAFFSLVLFTKTKKSEKGFKRTVLSYRFTPTRPGESPEPKKAKRNKVYYACGITILLCLLLIPLYSNLWEGTAINVIKPVFWLEAIMIWAFGFAWFVKGRTIWKDEKPPRKKQLVASK
jgi:hypothetical protein